MRSNIAIQKIKPLLKKRFFSSKEAIAYGVSSSTLAYYVKIGELVRIGYGLYKVAGSSIVDDFRWENLVESYLKVKGGIICLMSALSFYEITEELTTQHWIAVNNSTRHRSKGDIRIVRMRNTELGRIPLMIGGIEVQIFDRERTIVDSFRYLSFEIAIKSLRFSLRNSAEKKIDINKINQYAKTLGVNIRPYILTETII